MVAEGAAGDPEKYAQWCKFVAGCSMTCITLRSALLGPASGSLWRTVTLSSAHSGLSVQQS